MFRDVHRPRTKKLPALRRSATTVRPPLGLCVERHILVKRARMCVFLAFDYHHRYEEAVTRLSDWIRQDRIRYVEDIVDGIENCPGAIAELYRGENLGKRLIRLCR